MANRPSVKELGTGARAWESVLCFVLLFGLSNPCPGNDGDQLSPHLSCPLKRCADVTCWLSARTQAMSLKGMRPGMPQEPSEGSSEVVEPKGRPQSPLPDAVLGVPDWSQTI